MLPAATKAFRDIAYVPNGHEKQTLDLFLPESRENLPLIIYIHGGAFRAGNKAQLPAVGYLEKGYALASLGYRFVSTQYFRRR